jgi:hypothetical protein
MNDMEIEAAAAEAIANEKQLEEQLQRLLSKDDNTRFTSFKIIFFVSHHHPSILYPKWDFFARLLKDPNSYRQLIAIRILAQLTKVDVQNKFEELFETYYDILKGKKTMTAAHLVANSGIIAQAKPSLEPEITKKLLSIDILHQGKQKELIKGYALEAFSDYFQKKRNKTAILSFARKLINSDSPKTAKKAKEFLQQWDTQFREAGFDTRKP